MIKCTQVSKYANTNHLNFKASSVGKVIYSTVEAHLIVYLAAVISVLQIILGQPQSGKYNL